MFSVVMYKDCQNIQPCNKIDDYKGHCIYIYIYIMIVRINDSQMP